MAAGLQQILLDLAQLSLEQLIPIHNQLGLANVEEAEDSQLNRWVLLTRFLSSQEVAESDDNGAAHFLRIRTYLNGLNGYQC